MIVRVIRFRVARARVAQFNAIMRAQLATLREQPGLAYVKVARRIQPDGAEEAILFEEWVDAASLYAWVGPVLTEPRLLPGTRELVDEIMVAHYELLPEAPGEGPIGGDRSAAGAPAPEFELD